MKTIQFRSGFSARSESGQRSSHPWRLPGRAVLLFGAAFCMLLVGAGLVVQAQILNSSSISETEIDALQLRLVGRQWLVDQMHGSEAQQFPMPGNMMPDMPTHGLQRLHIEMGLYNHGRGSRLVRVEEFELRGTEGATGGTVWSPTDATVANMELRPAHALNMSLFFDVPDSASGLRLVWSRNGETVEMAVPDPPGPDQVQGPPAGYINSHNHDDHDH